MMKKGQAGKESPYFLIIGSASVLGQVYEQNGVGKKNGRVRLNRLSGRKMGERHGGRKAEISGAFQKERESAGVERSRISRGFGKQRKDRGTSGRVLGCLTVRVSRKSIFIQQSRIVLPSSLALPFRIALVCLLVLQLCSKVHTHKQNHMHGQRVRHKIANRERRASSVLAPRPLSVSPCLQEMGRMA